MFEPNFEDFEQLLDSRCFLCISRFPFIAFEALVALPVATMTIQWPYLNQLGQSVVEPIRVCADCGGTHQNDHRVKIIRETAEQGAGLTMLSVEHSRNVN
jgi:hypothetical protein